MVGYSNYCVSEDTGVGGSDYVAKFDYDVVVRISN